MYSGHEINYTSFSCPLVLVNGLRGMAAVIYQRTIIYKNYVLRSCYTNNL